MTTKKAQIEQQIRKLETKKNIKIAENLERDYADSSDKTPQELYLKQGNNSWTQERGYTIHYFQVETQELNDTLELLTNRKEAQRYNLLETKKQLKVA